MEILSVLPSLGKNQWDIINSNGVGAGIYNPMNWVVMDNVLIQSVHNMNNMEQKLFEFLISLIDTRKPVRELKVKKLDIIHFLFPKTRGKKSTEFNHSYYNQLRVAIKRLNNTAITIKFDNKKGEMGLSICSFIDHDDIEYLTVVFSPEILPFLCYLKGNFTKYKIGYIEKLKQKYSICLYKYFIMRINARENNKKISWQEDLKDLKFILDIQNKYKEFSDIKKRILDPAVKEINKHTDIHIEYDVIRGGVKNIQIIALEFKAKKKYKETAIEKSKNKNKTKIPKETFSKTQNSTGEKTIPVAICADINTSEKVKEQAETEKKMSFFKKIKKIISIYKSI